MWWLPLRSERRQKLQLDRFQKFLLAQNNKKYDPVQAIQSGLSKLHDLPVIGRFTRSREDLDRLFCSELAAAALKQAQERVRVAQANLAKVKAGAKTGEIEAQKAAIARIEAELSNDIAAQEATVARLEAELNNAQVEYQRYQKLYGDGAI